ncbi:acyl carrier protein [Bacillus pseudomycoides]|nr:acyl carrier protein [Bacillus pseudomycoides]
MFELIKNILIDLGIEENVIHPDAYLRGDLEVDSAETVGISLELKKQFDIEFNFEARQDMKLSDLCELLDNEKAKALN